MLISLPFLKDCALFLYLLGLDNLFFNTYELLRFFPLSLVLTTRKFYSYSLCMLILSYVVI